jgi:hypothetical protein
MSEPRPRTESELVELVRSIDAPAPTALHREVHALISAGRASAASTGRGSAAGVGGGFPLLRPLLAGTALAAVVVVVVVVATVLAIALNSGSGGGTSTMSMPEASASTLRPATAPAPPQRAGNRAQLAVAVDGVSFPSWQHLGWRSTGARSDRVGGHTMTTVFYANARGYRVGYAIIAGAAPRVSGGTLAWRGGTYYRLSFADGAPVVTWRRDGHMCVLSGRGVSSTTLMRLADWGEPA